MQAEIVLGKKIEWGQAHFPKSITHSGRYVILEPFNAEKHYRTLYENLSTTPELWNYIYQSKPESLEEYRLRCLRKLDDKTRQLFAISKTSAPEDYVGLVALMSVSEKHRTIEIGVVTYSSKLQKTPAGTEVHYLLLKHCFEELGFLRVEWKCNSLNEASKAAALRLGFRYEGTLRRHLMCKGYSRDSCLYSIIDDEWPTVRTQLQRWLDPTNFDEQGRQKTKLQQKHE